MLASVTTKELAVKVATLKFPRLSIFIKFVPLSFWKEAMAAVWVEVARTTKVGVVEAAEKDWTYNNAVGEVVPIPTLLRKYELEEPMEALRIAFAGAKSMLLLLLILILPP